MPGASSNIGIPNHYTVKKTKNVPCQNVACSCECRNETALARSLQQCQRPPLGWPDPPEVVSETNISWQGGALPVSLTTVENNIAPGSKGRKNGVMVWAMGRDTNRKKKTYILLKCECFEGKKKPQMGNQRRWNYFGKKLPLGTPWRIWLSGPLSLSSSLDFLHCLSSPMLITLWLNLPTLIKIC